MEKELAAAEGTSICQLPNNILVDIFSRLPIKSVINCRCVCKSFMSVISEDPEFPPLHLSRSPPPELICPFNKSILFVDYDNQRYHQLNLLIDDDGSHPLVPVNSSRGLLCFQLSFSTQTLLVLNPITLEYTQIPHPVMNLTKKHKPGIVHFGFGYSPITDKYKALAITHYTKSLRSATITTTLISIYTIGGPSSSWRRIEDAPELYLSESFPIYLNGSLHWLLKKNSHDYMLTFDFDNEKFGEIAMPPFDTVEKKQLKIVVFEGLLSVCVLINRKTIDVWVMKEYGVSTSWCKEIVVETPDMMLRSSHPPFPLKYVNNDKEAGLLTFMTDKTLVTYDLVKRRIVKFNVLPLHKLELNPLMHVPILLPLKDLIVGAKVGRITDLSHNWITWDF